MNEKRLKLRYALLSTCTVAAGLFSRTDLISLPYLTRYAGDALWAMMIYWMTSFLLPSLYSVRKACIALLFCYLIEFGQLYQASWINSVRKTLLGALILGKGFLLSDLVCYFTGILIACVTDHLTLPGKELHDSY